MTKYYLQAFSAGATPGVCLSGDIPNGAVECTLDQYNNAASYTVSNGAIVARVIPTLSLQQQAASLLPQQQASVMQTYTVYGEDTPTAWLTYLKALRAIANGTDTTSVALPTAPTT